MYLTYQFSHTNIRSILPFQGAEIFFLRGLFNTIEEKNIKKKESIQSKICVQY